MAATGNFRPTLLVGVGGTGLRIAEGILKQAIDNDSSITSRIGILAIDTDQNDIKKLKFVPKDAQAQISQPEKVYRLLERNSEVEPKWCYSRKSPEMSEDILDMTMIEGAGQLRMLTRLALHDSFEHQGLKEKFGNAIARLAVHSDDQAYDGAIHILIVGSLAGATGSGSFVQVAMALKEAAAARPTMATVRGVFLLPDVYVRTGALKSSQVPNVLANGYAALKELNAITVRAKMPHRKTDFEFEYTPGAKLMDGASPYEAVTLIDFENTAGGSMGRNIDAYVEMAARAGYLQIFSPIGARYGSVTINDVRQKVAAVANGTTNLYGGVGVAALKYPKDSMAKFLGRKLVQENLKGDWMRLDVAFRNQVTRFKEESAGGKTGGEEPDIRKTYIRDLAQLAKQDPRIPFFRNIHDFLNPEKEDEKTYEKVVSPRHKTFLNALTDYVSNSFWSEGDTSEVKSRSMLDSSSLLESDSIVDTVRRTEADLDRSLRVLETALQSRPEDIYQNDLVSSDSLGVDEWGEHHLQAHIIRSSPHPVAVRALLYLIRAELERRRSSIDTRDMKLKLFRIANEFRDDDEMATNGNRPATRSTPKVVEQASKVEEGSILNKIFSRKKRAFAESYVDYYNTSLTQMIAYASAVIEAKVYDQAIGEINALVRVFEGLFTEIENIGETLKKEIRTERDSFGRSESFDGNANVYANAACKDDAWTRLSESAQGLRLDDKVNQQLVQSVFNKHREDKRLMKTSSFKQLNELFWSQVVVGFGERTVEQDFASSFDFTVIEAMRRQFAVEDKIAALEAAENGAAAPRVEDVNERMKKLVERTSRQSLPYLTLARPNTDGSQIKFWAIHQKSKDDIGSDTLFSEMFQAEDGNEPIVEDDFSRYELTCINLRVNVELQHLTKLGMGEKEATSTHARTVGSYAKAYNEMLDRMNDVSRAGRAGAEFTPHVDKNWHKPGSLPEIFAELDEKISGDAARSYVIARTHNLLKLENDGGPETRFSALGFGLSDAIDEAIAPTHDPWAVYEAFEEHFGAVQNTLEIWEKMKDKQSAEFRSHKSYKALTDTKPLIAIMQIAAARNRNVEERDETVINAIDAWIELIRELLEAQETSMTPRALKQALEEHVSTARDALFDALRLEAFPESTVRVFDRLFAKGFDRAMADSS